MNSLTELFPEIASQWDYERNNEKHKKDKKHPLTPNDVVVGSNKKVAWECDEGPDHRWDTTVSKRTRERQGCPYCAGKEVSVTNSLAENEPEIAKEWDYECNNEKHKKCERHPATPDKVTRGSTKKVWWVCEQGHKWQAQVQSRTGKRRTGCPTCAPNKQRRDYVTDENRLSIKRPDIAALWDFERNAEENAKNPKHPLKPSEVAIKSNKKVFWKCDEGPNHRWKAAPFSIERSGKGCPFCDGKKVSITNSLATRTFWENSKDNQKIKATWRCLIEWDYSKNSPIRPEDVVFSSNETFAWRCIEHGHRWTATVNQRTNSTLNYPGCPYCAGKKVSAQNALFIQCPSLAAEWDYERNNEKYRENNSHPRTPMDVVVGSNKKIWWKCFENPSHSWEATPNERNGLNRKGTGCPHCHQAATSFTEALIRCELMPFFPDISHDDREVVGDKVDNVDVKIPSENLIIEYDGHYYHKEVQNREEADRQKTERLTKSGWRVIRIREEGLNLIQPHDLSVERLSGHVDKSDYKKLMNAILAHIGDFLQKEITGLNEYFSCSDLSKWNEANSLMQKTNQGEVIPSGGAPQLTLFD